jgi:Holliday junction DNA helicase RuvA
MIAFVRGILTEKNPTHVVIDHQGIGLEILIPLSTFASLPGAGTSVSLFTHLHVREDALTLIGFASLPEKELFQMLLSVSGIGVRSGLSILSGSNVADLYGFIARGDETALTRIQGLGKKTAQRLILDLKDKAAQKMQGLPGGAAEGMPQPGAHEEQALQALVSLGFSKAEAQKALAKAMAKLGDQADIEMLIRSALQG